MGTATLETDTAILKVAHGDKMIEKELFYFWHGASAGVDLALVVDKRGGGRGHLHLIGPGESKEIPGIGTVRHQKWAKV